MEQDLGRGRTPLLVALIPDGNIEPSTIRLLLQRGANIAARDHDGGTCLHLVFKSARTIERLKDSLCLLVRAGADIHAIDEENHSVSEWAIKFQLWHIWESVLRACGKDIDQIKTEMREKGCRLPVPGDPDYCYSEEDDRYSEAGDHQHDTYPPGDCDEIDDFQEGSESDSDCSTGGAELSSGAL